MFYPCTNTVAAACFNIFAAHECDSRIFVVAPVAAPSNPSTTYFLNKTLAGPLGKQLLRYYYNPETLKMKMNLTRIAGEGVRNMSNSKAGLQPGSKTASVLE